MFVGKMSDWLRSPEVANSNFLIWVYRRVYTPYEINERFSDESVFEDSHACEVRIKEVIELSDGDYLLGVQSYDEIEEKYYAQIDYYKLSEIRLARKNHKGNEECSLFEDIYPPIIAINK